MPKIEIREYDLTTPGRAIEDVDVVFVPGLVSEDAGGILDYNTPVLLTTLNDFSYYVGERPYYFESDIKYSDINKFTPDSGIVGFSQNAIPKDNILFRQKQADPSYVVAKELINAGLPVLYQRINPYKKSDTPTDITNFDDGDGYSNFTYEGVITPIATFGEGCPLQMFNTGEIYTTEELRKFLGDFTVTVSGDPLEEGTENRSTRSFYNVKAETNEEEDEIHYSILPSTTLSDYISEVPVEGVNDTTYYKILQPFGYLKPYFKLFTFNESNDNAAVLDGQIFRDSDTNSSEKAQHLKEMTVVEDDKVVLPMAFVNEFNNTQQFAMLDPTKEVILDKFIKADNLTIGSLNTPTIKATSTTFSIQALYGDMENIFADEQGVLKDRGNISIKYLTSGGYPTYELYSGSIVTKMLALCENRGDCYALIDHTNNPDRPLNPVKPESLYASIKHYDFGKAGEYGVMYTPYMEFNRATSDNVKDTSYIYDSNEFLPASFGYLLALASMIKNNPSWLAVAGATRGTVPNLTALGTQTPITNMYADEMQPRGQGTTSINPITNIKPYGNVIWGNRTLKFNKENLTATSFVNIRNLLCNLKKVCYSTSRALTFENDTESLWLNFKSRIERTLNSMVAGNGISGYRVMRDIAREQESGEKAILCAKIVLYPIYAIEDFYIDIYITDNETAITG